MKRFEFTRDINVEGLIKFELGEIIDESRIIERNGRKTFVDDNGVKFLPKDCFASLKRLKFLVPTEDAPAVASVAPAADDQPKKKTK